MRALKESWNHLIVWIDWQGRASFVAGLAIALCGSVLAAKVAQIWANVSGVYFWIFAVLVFAIFLCTLSIAGSKMRPMSRGVRVQATAHVHYLMPDIDGPQVLL